MQNGLVEWTTWAASIVNGFWGDYLHERGNGLAVAMAFYHHGQPLRMDRQALAAAHPQPERKICVLVHGLACNELLWQFTHRDGQPDTAETPATTVDYGGRLQAELGHTPFYVRYNTGLPVAANGRSLGRLLDALVRSYPAPIEEIVLIGHSMGGLVLRSACHYATTHGEPWVEQVKHVFYLGTPHDGADLARLAHAAETVLHAVPNPITRIVGDVFSLRSQGIKDLRYGTLVEPDVLDDGFDDVTHHHRRAVPWLPHAQHYLVAGTVRGDANHIAAVILGDGLVGAPANAYNGVPEANIRLFPGVRHMQLAHDWGVYQQIVAWLERAEGNEHAPSE